MKFKKLVNIAAIAFLAFGVGMQLWHSFQGGFLVTAKTLHPEIWAQLNDDSGDTTGGGTTTGGTDPGDKPGNPSDKVKKGYKMRDFDYDEVHDSDDDGIIIVLNRPYPLLLKNTTYTVTIRRTYCAFTGDMNDECDFDKEETRIVQILEGRKTAAPPTPPTP